MTTLLTAPTVPTVPTVPTLKGLGEQFGIPITVRPWWGSRRRHAFTSENGVRVPASWECPGGNTYAQVKRPEVQNGVVVMWEGPCRYRRCYRRHHHRQKIEVLDVGDHSLLVWVHAGKDGGNNGSHFLIGMDDGHPFVAPVKRRLTTVQDAFDWLVPNMVREAMVLGQDVKRQGDWFFIPYNRPVRETRARRCRVRPWRGTLRHGVHTNVVYSHAPLFIGYNSITRHIGQRVIFRSYPWPLVRGTVTAPDHPPLKLPTWHVAVRTRRTTHGNPGVRVIKDD